LPRTQREKAKAKGVDAPSFVGIPTDENGQESLAATEEKLECEKAELMDLLRSRIQDLPEKMRQVMTLYYAEGQRMRDIGEKLGLTESRVSQIHTNAIQRLRRMVKGLG
jgi:RNA polymerase sigma factor for flagellar operon FliA